MTRMFLLAALPLATALLTSAPAQALSDSEAALWPPAAPRC